MYTDRQWYLVAYDLGRDADRSFRLDRIEGALMPGEAFAPPSTLARAGATAFSRPWDMSDGDPEVQAQSPWAISHVGSSSVSATHADGSVELTLTVRSRPAFRTFVLGFLEHAEILAPPELRNDIIEWLRPLAQPTVGGVR